MLFTKFSLNSRSGLLIFLFDFVEIFLGVAALCLVLIFFIQLWSILAILFSGTTIDYEQFVTESNNLIGIGLSVIYFVIFYYIVDCLIKFVRNISNKNIFLNQNVRLLKIAGYLSLFSLVIDGVLSILSRPSNNFLAEFVAGLFLLILADAFKELGGIKEENDLTI